MISRLGKWVFSFFKPQTLRKDVLITGADDVGHEVQPARKDVYRGLVKYRPFSLDYLLVGIEHSRRDPNQIVYRFFDPETNKEFTMTKPLVDLLFYRVPGVGHDALPDHRDSIMFS